MQMIDTDARVNALLNAIAGFHSELQVMPYGSQERLIIYHDLLCCYREIFRLLNVSAFTIQYCDAWIRRRCWRSIDVEIR